MKNLGRQVFSGVALILATLAQGGFIPGAQAGEHSIIARDTDTLRVLEVGDNTFVLKRASFVDPAEGGDGVPPEQYAHLGSSASWAPRLIGNTSRVLLANPHLSYAIRVIPGQTSFLVELSCRLLDQKLEFIPVGFEWDKTLGNRDVFLLQESLRQKKPPYYVSEVHLGGIKTQGLTFSSGKESPPFPNHETYSFDGTPQGEDLFKQTAEDLLNQYSERYLLDPTTFQRFESPRTSGLDNGFYRAPILKKQSFWLSRWFGGQASEPSSAEARSRQVIQEAVNGYLNEFKRHVEDLVRSGRRAPLLLLADPHPLEEGLAYSPVGREVYSRAVPILLKLEKKYTLQVLEARDQEDRIVARIQVFPAQRGSLSQVKTTQVTWVYGEAKSNSVEVAIMHAFTELRRAAPHLFVGPLD